MPTYFPGIAATVTTGQGQREADILADLKTVRDEWAKNGRVAAMGPVFRRMKSAETDWEKWIANFAGFYDTAYTSYKGVLGAEAAAHKRNTELAIFVISVFCGTGLAVITAQATLKGALASLVTKMLTKSKIDSLKKNASFFEDNPVGVFVAGALFAEANSAVRRKMSASVSKVASGETGVSSGKGRPVGQLQKLLKLTDTLKTCVGASNAMIREMEQTEISMEEGLEIVECMYRSDFQNPPKVKNDDGKAAVAIELALFLELMSSRTYQIVMQPVSGRDRRSGGKSPVTKESILAPDTRAGYRPWKPGQMRSINGKTVIGIGITDLGDIVCNHINVLHNQIFGWSLIKLGYGAGDNLDPGELIEGRRALVKLGEKYTLI